MGAPKPPSPPDPAATAQAQGAANRETAIAQARLNNPNVFSPYGTQEVVWQPTAQTPGGPPDPDFLQPIITQSLSPQEQAIFESNQRVRQQLGDVAQTAAGNVQQSLGTPLSFAGVPDSAGVENATYDAMMSRINEDHAQRRETMSSQLIAGGIRPGTEAYRDRMGDFDRTLTDARQQALLGSRGEGRATRNQAIAELMALRQYPLNEASALMSGSQVSSPFSTPGFASNTPVGAAPHLAATRLGYEGSLDAYNARAGAQGNLMSGLFGIGSAGLMGGGGFPGLIKGVAGLFSDRRLKSRIRRIGRTKHGLGLYRYRIFGREKIGVMADEVLEVMPLAVTRHPSGYLMVDYQQVMYG